MMAANLLATLMPLENKFTDLRIKAIMDEKMVHGQDSERMAISLLKC